MKISVVVPAHNSERTIGATLSGLLTQTLAPTEIIVVDDGSTDRTADVVRALGDDVRCLRQDNRGPAAARNTAILAATTDHIAWCDADDIWLPAHLQAAAQAFEERGGGRRFVTANAYYLLPSGLSGQQVLGMPHPRRDQQRLASLQGTFIAAMCFYPRRLHDEIGMLDETLRFGEDRDLWIRALLSGWECIRQPTPHALYRWTGASASGSITPMARAEDRILGKALAHPRLTRKERQYLQLRLREGSPRECLRVADDLLRNGDRRGAATLLRKAARLRPADRRLASRAALAAIPGAGRLEVWRRRRLDAVMGWREQMTR